MKSRNRWMRAGLVLGFGTLCIVLARSARAQVQTATTTKTGQPSEVVRVEHGEVVTVEGNDLIVQMADGSIRHFENIPESARITVHGKELGIHDLKPGMLLQRTITTTTTPKVVTTVQTVKGKVWNINPPLSVILTLEDGTNQSFNIPKEQKFNVNGQMVDAFALRKGMVLTATKVVEEPMSVTEQQKKVIGTMPRPPPTPPTDAPLLVAEGEPTAAPPEATVPAAAEPAATPENRGPAEGSFILWVVFIMLLLIVVWIASKFRRTKNRA
jgi:hypothetical protein